MDVKIEKLIEGLMVYWSEVDNATRYNVHLLVVDYNKPVDQRNQEIKVVECDRHTKVYSFTNLAYIHKTLPSYYDGYLRDGKDTGLRYGICVDAEDKEGKIIEKSYIITGNVILPFSGDYLK